MKWVLRIAVMMSVLVVGRELHLRQTEITAVAGAIDAERDAIDLAETGLDALDRDIGAAADTIGLLDARIVAIERRHPTGIPPGEYGTYQRLVTERNDLARRQNSLIEQQRRLVAEYGARVAAHNARVDEATGLARRGAPGTVVRELWARLVGG